MEHLLKSWILSADDIGIERHNESEIAELMKAEVIEINESLDAELYLREILNQKAPSNSLRNFAHFVSTSLDKEKDDIRNTDYYSLLVSE